MPWRPRAASFRYSSRCSPAASHTCFGAAASRRPSLPPPGCGVSSSSDLSEEKTIKNAHFMQIYRSREVGQTYITSIATTLLATMHAMWLVISIRPQVIFCNGPGTCFPLCVCAFALKNRTWADINLVTIANLFIHNLKLMPDLDAICLSTVAPAATKLPSSILRWPFDVKTHPHPMLGYHVYQVKIMNTLTIFVH
ncbi:uncharacterized protein LOC120656326 isoform X3 [Panicum virgatum]|uniref:uncharacterized protein LOC120656326 isoform X3 n=1 Tax=Panicum virgatum TaxID=38727 RepID=UPI0019D5A521|nr:uncharacterized protein LOC120656326 isoform X3 [Panicum virgatum]